MTRPLDLTGKKFNRLTALKRVENNKHGQAVWLCKCNCGNEIKVVASELKRGHVKSCGCLNLENCINNLPDNHTHRLSRTPIYRMWFLMRQRCENPKHKSYKDYGGRGIKICDKCLKPDNFFKWAFENGYAKGLTIDRIDNNGNYCPENCRFVSMHEQSRNKRNNVKIMYKGKEMLLLDVSKLVKIPYRTLLFRYKMGDRNERLFRPIDVSKRRKVA